MARRNQTRRATVKRPKLGRGSGRYMAQAVMGYRYTEDYVRPNGKVFWKAGARGDDPE